MPVGIPAYLRRPRAFLPAFLFSRISLAANRSIGPQAPMPGSNKKHRTGCRPPVIAGYRSFSRAACSRKSRISGPPAALRHTAFPHRTADRPAGFLLLSRSPSSAPCIGASSAPGQKLLFVCSYTTPVLCGAAFPSFRSIPSRLVRTRAA